MGDRIPATATSPPETPALRFLNRGHQLNRIEQRVIKQMYFEIEAEQAAMPVDINTPEDAKRVMENALAGIASSRNRWSDVDLTLQLFYCRHVDNFQIFLEDLLRTMLVRQPKLLKRGDDVSMDEVLSHATMEQFLEASIDRHIYRLAYKSIHDFARIVQEQTGFQFFPSSNTARAIEKIFALRNLITHNYGIVNKLHFAKYPDDKLEIGKPYPYTPEEIKAAWETLFAAATDIEKRARQKFKLFEVYLFTAPE